jgi:hypothetical protein
MAGENHPGKAASAIAAHASEVVQVFPIFGGERQCSE